MKLADVLDWFGFGSHAPAAGHHHSHGDEEGHGHTHGVIDPTIASTQRGIWAIKWSFVLLAVTAVFQIIVVAISGSVALLADTIHNFADATTAIPLWIAFRLARWKPTETFTYGYGRVEDLAGIVIVAIILFSAIVAGYEAIDRIFHPQPIGALMWVAIAGLIGFIGNEAVAVFRIRVGREINSAALIADGYHARTDGLTSLAVIAGATGVWLGFPLADPIVGLLITIAIFGIVWQSAKSVLTRMLDGVEPGLVAEIRHSAEHVKDIREILDVKARWLGHKLHTDVAILIDGGASMNEADKISSALKKELFAHIPVLTVANVRVHGAAPETVAPQVTDHGHEGEHHHAPEPFKVASAIATGLLEIIGTPKGERMRLTLDHPVEGLAATVTIDRAEGKVEVLPLVAVANTALTYQSAVAPEEPHEFSAQLRLKVGDRMHVSNFKMAEPEGHHH
jgi:cation diffusion facilitator family transporter